MEIKKFSDLTIEQVKYIADSNYNYWKQVNPDLNYEESTSNIISMKENYNTLPLGLALVDNDKLIGFCTLRTNRLKHHLNFNPWLCNLLIFEDYRGKGYGKTMINYACKKINELGYDKIYAWTDQAPEFYKKLGWQFVQNVIKNEGGEALLFVKTNLD